MGGPCSSPLIRIGGPCPLALPLVALLTLFPHFGLARPIHGLWQCLRMFVGFYTYFKKSCFFIKSQFENVKFLCPMSIFLYKTCRLSTNTHTGPQEPPG